MKKIALILLGALLLCGCAQNNKENNNNDDDTPIIEPDDPVTPEDPVDPIDPNEPIEIQKTYVVKAMMFNEENFATLSSYTKFGISFVFDKGTNKNNAPAYSTDRDAARMYPNNTLTISAKNITSIIFTFDDRKDGNFLVNTGEYTGDEEYGSWEGNTDEIIFTVENISGNQKRIIEMEITCDDTGEENDDVLFNVASELSFVLTREYNAFTYDSEDDVYFMLILDERSLEEAVIFFTNKTVSSLEDATLVMDVYQDYWDDDETDVGYFSLIEYKGVLIEIGSYLNEQNQTELQITVFYSEK